MVTPLVRVKSVKKRTNRFIRHQSDRRMTVKVQCKLRRASIPSCLPCAALCRL